MLIKSVSEWLDSVGMYNGGILEHKETRIYLRNKETFNNMSDKEKKKFDANFIFGLLKKEFPTEEFTLMNYYDTNAKVCYLSDKSSLLNVWRREENDGLKDKLSYFLNAHGLDHSWISLDKNKRWWDGIYIKPKDYINFAFYYGIDRQPKIKKEEIDEKTHALLVKAIKEFSKEGPQIKNTIKIADDQSYG